jgi:hypothetical protein
MVGVHKKTFAPLSSRDLESGKRLTVNLRRYRFGAWNITNRAWPFAGEPAREGATASRTKGSLRDLPRVSRA